MFVGIFTISIYFTPEYFIWDYVANVVLLSITFFDVKKSDKSMFMSFFHCTHIKQLNAKKLHLLVWLRVTSF